MTNFTLVQLPVEEKNQNQEEGQDYTSQRTLLCEGDNEDKLVARVDAYLDDNHGYYSSYWVTTMPESELVRLFEECIAAYETAYPNGVPDLTGGLTDPFGKGQPTGKYQAGVIVYVRVGDKGDSFDLPYERPLNWEQVLKAANGREVTLGRFNTPIGDLIIDQYGQRMFGVISHLKATEPFAKLMANTSSEGVTFEQAMALFEKSLSGFPEIQTS